MRDLSELAELARSLDLWLAEVPPWRRDQTARFEQRYELHAVMETGSRRVLPYPPLTSDDLERLMDTFDGVRELTRLLADGTARRGWVQVRYGGSGSIQRQVVGVPRRLSAAARDRISRVRDEPGYPSSDDDNV